MPRRGKSRAKIASSWSNYWQRTQQPLQALFFLLPLIVLYEVGTLIYAHDNARGVTYFIYARSLLRGFFEWFGVTGYYLPGLIVVAVLLSLHLFRRDPWRFEPRLYLLMLLESFVLALPLFVFLLVLARQPQAQAGGAVEEASWQAQMIFSFGAGIYEELLFRLVAIALLHLILVDVLALPDHVGAGIAVSLSAIAFAMYHFSGSNPFVWGRFFQYTLAGLYFAGVYVLRGFGVVAGVHAIYDVLVVLLQLLLARGHH